MRVFCFMYPINLLTPLFVVDVMPLNIYRYQHQDYADFRRDYNRFQRTPSRDDDPDWEDFSNTTAATAIPAADIVPPMVFPNSHNNSNDNDHGLPATPTAGAVLVVTGATSVDTSGSWVVANNDNTVPQQALHQKEQQRRSGRGSPRKARGGGGSWTGDNKVSPSAAKTMQDRNDKNKMSGRRGGGAGGVVHEKGYPAYDANNSQQRQVRLFRAHFFLIAVLSIEYNAAQNGKL